MNRRYFSLKLPSGSISSIIFDKLYLSNMNRTLLLILMFLLSFQAQGQGPIIQRLVPAFWWTGMNHNQLEIVIYGAEISGSRVSLEYEGVTFNGVTQVENPNYLFLNLTITDQAEPGFIPIIFEKYGERLLVQYELKARSRTEAATKYVGQEDLIYLIMPDRFANGDPSNDAIAGLQQATVDREGKYQRHGGDLAGIENKLDYLQSIGVTTLWLNPVEINDQPHESYHGYAATDHYQVDPRFGGNEAYKSLVDACHARGMKVIRDVVYNHVGDYHWLMRDKPSSDWVHQWEEFTKTSYRAPTLLDPYASTADKKIMTDGWFDTHMPDLNQHNEHVASYLIQNSIWWIENFGVNGYRIDTYAYPDQQFMADWAEAILAEYPGFSFFGETWVHNVPVQSWFTANTPNKDINSQMAGVTDFQLQYALMDALHQNFGWTEGLSRIYYVLAQDYVYENPWANVVFLDNHDISRFYASVNEDMNKMKMATAFTFTTRGIPQIYYGTEILMREPFDWGNHDKVRMEFPGGWEGDAVNKFTAGGRTDEENEYFNYFRRLAQFRKVSPALTAGSLTQFVPEEGIYVYARVHSEQTILVIMNQNKEEKGLNWDRFQEVIGESPTARNIMTDEVVSFSEGFTAPGTSTTVLEILR